ncbi:putative nucleic-acid-binding Zn-ribbon protein [Paenibacillus phyllosphaerae]|uniref:Putative nucleic-acid-binding Zn-ribbon protein n=1 Tax=Paenibacillus phyllosphaerae TaxID=274593 RepID=A0A7W5FLH6_9BACL|nr:hypothetical protein [Paenibacillus phyllosphaerae]MBB3109108.1 putative nucleic-acid-binding Zn-ribbon protein [Paenibacillus phyllosphaerae]
MEKTKWIFVCPNCENEEETEEEYTKEELDKKGLLIDAQRKRIIKHCLPCRTNVNRRDYP